MVEEFSKSKGLDKSFNPTILNNQSLHGFKNPLKRLVY
jgi:hypothetical protein